MGNFVAANYDDAGHGPRENYNYIPVRITAADFTTRLNSTTNPLDRDVTYNVDGTRTVYNYSTGQWGALGSGGSSSAATTSGFQNQFGIQSAIAEPSPDGAMARVLKIQAKAKPLRARVRLRNKSSVMDYSNVLISMAPTEVADFSTPTNAYNAIQNGSVNNADSSDVNPLGFKRLTWRGAASSQRIRTANSSIPAFGYQINHGRIISDWVEIPAIECVDKPGEYYVIVRYEKPAVTNEAVGYYQPSQLDVVQAKYAIGDAMLVVCGGATTPVTVPANIPGASYNNNMPPFDIEFDYGIPTVSAVAILDSFGESYQFARQAVLRKSTAAKPWTFLNLSGSTCRSENMLGAYYAHLQDCLEYGSALPKVCIAPAVSVNNYSPLSNFKLPQAQAELKRNLETIALNDSLGIKSTFIACINFGAETAGTPIKYLHDAMRTLAAAGKITWSDINADPRFIRSVYNAGTNPAGMFDPDGTHPSGQNTAPYMTGIELETIDLLAALPTI